MACGELLNRERHESTIVHLTSKKLHWSGFSVPATMEEALMALEHAKGLKDRSRRRLQTELDAVAGQGLWALGAWICS